MGGTPGPPFRISKGIFAVVKASARALASGNGFEGFGVSIAKPFGEEIRSPTEKSAIIRQCTRCKISPKSAAY